MAYNNIVSRAKVAALQGVKKGGAQMPIATLKAGMKKKGK